MWCDVCINCHSYVADDTTSGEESGASDSFYLLRPHHKLDFMAEIDCHCCHLLNWQDLSPSNFALAGIITPAPLRRRNAPDSILTSIHPSLRSWLAPLIFPRRHHQQHNTDSGHGGDGQQQFQQSTSRQKENWNGNSRRRQIPPAFNAPLNRHNLGQHLDQLLLSHYDASTPDSQESREEEVVDVLEDSSRVAHQVADLLTNFEVQSAGQRKLFDNSTPKSNPKWGLISQTDA